MEVSWLDCCFPVGILTKTHLYKGLQVIFAVHWVLKKIKERELDERNNKIL